MIYLSDSFRYKKITIFETNKIQDEHFIPGETVVSKHTRCKCFGHCFFFFKSWIVTISYVLLLFKVISMDLCGVCLSKVYHIVLSEDNRIWIMERFHLSYNRKNITPLIKVISSCICLLEMFYVLVLIILICVSTMCINNILIWYTTILSNLDFIMFLHMRLSENVNIRTLAGCHCLDPNEQLTVTKQCCSTLTNLPSMRFPSF